MKSKLLLLLACMTMSLGVQAGRQHLVLAADTLKKDSVKTDTLAADTVKTEKEKKKKEESEYEKLLKKGGSTRTGMFTVRKIEGKHYFEVPDSMLGRLFLCVTRFTAVPQGFGQFAGEEINHCTVYMEKRDSATLLMRQYVLSYLADEKYNIARRLEK